MGKDIKGKVLGVGISQRSDGFYVGRFTTKYGQRKQKLFRTLQECSFPCMYSDIRSPPDVSRAV